MSDARCWKQQFAALAVATNSLSGCATDGSDGHTVGTCPPVVEYSREFQARAADELALLPEGSAIAEMLADYAVMREQARSGLPPRFRGLLRQSAPHLRR
jgi:hypothetical protein